MQNILEFEIIFVHFSIGGYVISKLCSITVFLLDPTMAVSVSPITAASSGSEELQDTMYFRSEHRKMCLQMPAKWSHHRRHHSSSESPSQIYNTWAMKRDVANMLKTT